MNAIRILISGRVQGVGYRWFAEQEAVDHGVRGYVRNLPDGQVEVFAQAPTEALESFCERLRQGPPAARVRAITATPASCDERLRDFRVTF